MSNTEYLSFETKGVEWFRSCNHFTPLFWGEIMLR